MEGPKEACGVVAVYNYGSSRNENAAPLVVKALLEMQNRGQLSAGLTSYNPDRDRILQTHKDTGSVQQVFQLGHAHKSKRLMDEYGGQAAIGHNRYATSGADDSSNAQPFERPHGRVWKWFAIAFNGNLANYDSLKAELEQSQYHLTYHSDTEVMMHQLNREMRGDEPPDFKEMFRNLSETFDGAYNIAFLNAAGELVVMRDPLGIKPMCYGEKDGRLVVASESVVLTNLDMPFQMLEPGEMIIADPQGWRVERYAPSKRSAYCFFEWIYFANLASSMEGRSVYKVRHAVGRELAKMELAAGQPMADMVVAVPETAKAVANSFGYHMGLPVMDGLLRNRYVGRTFIEGINRQDTIRLKFTPLQEILEGQRIYLVDDTLVRGSTLQTVVNYLRERGKVKEVHVRIGCPPVMGPCFYGIDMSTVEELFAPAWLDARQPERLPPEVLQKMAEEVGADSLGYLSMDGLQHALELPRDRLCMACLTTEYPTAAGQERYALALPDTKGRPVKKDADAAD